MEQSDNYIFSRGNHLEWKYDCVFLVKKGTRNVSTVMNPGTYNLTQYVPRYNMLFLLQNMFWLVFIWLRVIVICDSEYNLFTKN